MQRSLRGIIWRVVCVLHFLFSFSHTSSSIKKQIHTELTFYISALINFWLLLFCVKAYYLQNLTLGGRASQWGSSKPDTQQGVTSVSDKPHMYHLSSQSKYCSQSFLTHDALVWSITCDGGRGTVEDWVWRVELGFSCVPCFNCSNQ